MTEIARPEELTPDGEAPATRRCEEHEVVGEEIGGKSTGQ